MFIPSTTSFKALKAVAKTGTLPGFVTQSGKSNTLSFNPFKNGHDLIAAAIIAGVNASTVAVAHTGPQSATGKQFKPPPGLPGPPPRGNFGIRFIKVLRPLRAPKRFKIPLISTPPAITPTIHFQ